MIPRKDKFPGEHKLTPVAHKMKRFVLNAEGDAMDSEIINPPILPSKDLTTTVDFPNWEALTCDEILKAIEQLKFTMTVIRVDEVTYNAYLSQIAMGEAMYMKKCTGGIKSTKDETPLCADNEILTDVTECPECTKFTPPCELPCRVVKKCVPKGGGVVGGTGGILLGGLGPTFSGGGSGGGGGAEEEKKAPYSWLWLVFMAAGVYFLTRKSE